MSAMVTIPIRRRPRPPQPPRVVRTPRVPRTPVLVVTHPDGFVEVFGENLNVHTALMLDGGDCPKAEITASEYLTVGLPKRFRPLYNPEKPAAVGQCESRSPEVELQRLQDLRTVRALRPPALKSRLKREPVKVRRA